MEFAADDDFVGILTLDVASIKVETARTKTTSYEMKVTREYPRLSANDTSLLPKTVTENGKTYTLANVDWEAGNYETVDYEQLAEYYTAYATYTATGSSTKVTGYVTTAVYNGTLAKLTQGKTVYTAYFIGEEIRTPLEMTDLPKPTEAPTAVPTETPVDGAAITAAPEPTATAEPTEQSVADTDDALPTDGEDTENNNALFVIIPILAVLAGAAFYFLKIRRRKSDETITDTTADASSDDDGGDSGDGGRL